MAGEQIACGVRPNGAGQRNGAGYNRAVHIVLAFSLARGQESWRQMSAILVGQLQRKLGPAFCNPESKAQPALVQGKGRVVKQPHFKRSATRMQMERAYDLVRRHAQADLNLRSCRNRGARLL